MDMISYDKNVFYRISILIVLIILLLIPTSIKAVNWTQDAGNAQRTGYIPLKSL